MLHWPTQKKRRTLFAVSHWRPSVITSNRTLLIFNNLHTKLPIRPSTTETDTLQRHRGVLVGKLVESVGISHRFPVSSVQNRAE